MRFDAIRERAAIALGQGIDAGARERRIIDDRARLACGRKRERICEDHAALRIGVDHLDRRAVVGAHDVLRLVGGRADAVLGDREPAVHAQR